MLSPNLPAPMLLAIAIVTEVFASTCLAKSDGFTQLLPTLASLVGYAVAFYCLSQVVKSMPLGIVYAIWSGVGIVLAVAGQSARYTCHRWYGVDYCRRDGD